MEKHFRLIIIQVIPLMLLILVTLVISCNLQHIDILTKYTYIDYCFEEIMLYVKESKNNLGTIPISFKNTIITLDTTFYNTYISSETYIKEFLHDINWTNVIHSNKYNLIEIRKIILIEYLKNINDLEVIYNRTLITPNKLFDAQCDVLYAMYEYLQHITLTVFLDKEQIYDMFKENLIKNLDWANYIKTTDYQTKEYLFIKQVLIEKLIEIIAFYNEQIDQLNNEFIYEKKRLDKSYFLLNYIKNIIVLNILSKGVALGIFKHILFYSDDKTIYKIACYFLNRTIQEKEIFDLSFMIEEKLVKKGIIVSLMALRKLTILCLCYGYKIFNLLNDK